MNFILCGPHQTGKSTIGKLLALEWDKSFIDTDVLIEEHYAAQTQNKYSSRQISLAHGEAYFRDLEKGCIGTLQHVQNAVIAIGGGSILNPENRQVLLSLGRIIYLKSSADTLWERILQNGIPSFIDANNPRSSFLAMLEQRTPIYEKIAHFTVQIDGLPEKDIVAQIKTLISQGQ